MAHKYYDENKYYDEIIFDTPRLLPKEVWQLPTSHVPVISLAILQGTEPMI